ncbi:MAG: hypothetical protein Q9184_004630 [Pyrenodesmia sp. 2 TL-2023]
MSGETNSSQLLRPSASQQGIVGPANQSNELTLSFDSFHRTRTTKNSEPHTPNTTHLSPSVSGQSARLNSPSETSSASPQHGSPIPPSATGETVEKVDQVKRLRRKHNECRRRLQDLPYTGDRTPRLPTTDDFSDSLQVKIVPQYPKKDIKHAVVLLPQLGDFKSSLADLARELHKQQPETCFILLQGLDGVPIPKGKYHLVTTTGDWDEPALNSASSLTEMIRSSLIARCGFSPRDILLLGHGFGAMAVLATTALWRDIELGGAVSIEGPLPSYLQARSPDVIKTPVLIVGTTSVGLDHLSLEWINKRFDCVDTWTYKGAQDTVFKTDELAKPLLDFLAHRLRREEWNRQAIVSFDGGGIRGYASLLILKELMNKVGDEEKRLNHLEGKDVKALSSFAPWPFKAISPDWAPEPSKKSTKPDHTSGEDYNTESFPNSSLFLPCHYFDYAVGTSTGGLISIMLSRLRMTVDDCITEYKTLGQKIFGHPRPLAFGAVMWHKFDAGALEEAIQSVTARHSEKSEVDELDFPSDEDLCRTVVMAYAEANKTEAPYLFRTYYTPPPNADRKKTKQRQATARNHGPPAKLRIWQIGRATSAAPKYFPPIRIKRSMGDGSQRDVRFKDGGFGCNNPSEEAYNDIVHKHGDVSRAVGLLISIGTGLAPLELFAKTPGNLSNAIANIRAATKHPSRTLHVHDRMAHLSERDDKDIFDYYRFSGGEHLGEVGLAEWKSHRFTHLTKRSTEPGCKTLQKMDDAIGEYLGDPEVQEDLDKCAKLLVKRRRYRARDVSAWDRYASASFYECSYQKCQKSPHKTKELYKDHVKKMHYSALADQPLEAALRTSRRCWIYRNTPWPARSEDLQKAEPGTGGRPAMLASQALHVRSSHSTASEHQLGELTS